MPITEKKKKSIQNSILVFITVLAVVMLLSQEWFFSISPLKALELKLIDDRFQKRGPISLGDSSDVIILEINHDTFNQIPSPYNKWPWPRSIYAHVVNNLTEAGVKAIGIDVTMANKDLFDEKNDLMLIDAIRKSGKVVVAGKTDDYQNMKLEAEANKTPTLWTGENFNNIFYNADSSIGIVQPPADIDKVYRRYLPYLTTTVRINELEHGDQFLPSFSFALVNKYYGLPKSTIAKRAEGNFILGEKVIPSFDKYSMLVNFYGPSGSFERVPLIEVLDDKDFKTVEEIEGGGDLNIWEDHLASGKFKDKIVLVGSTMPEDRDLLNISYSKGENNSDNQMYGVEFHAHAIQNVINNDFLWKQKKISEILIVIIICSLAFWGTSLIRKIKAKSGLLIEFLNVFLILFLLYAIYQAGIYLFINNKIVISVVSPAIAVFLSYIGSTSYHFLKERKQNVLIKGMFSQYVNKQVVQELLNNPDKLKLGGDKKNVTVLFSDMAGFTTFSENKTPEELVKFINGLLHEMTELIMQSSGTLDKYLGDAVMAFWGAPLEQEDHALRACRTAVMMQKKVAEVSAEWILKGEKPLHMRLGLNSGDVIVGNVGGEKHKNYTVMGDNVNLASRLEGANKEYGSEIMISEATYELVKEHVLVRELDLLRVKGKQKPTKVYELIGMIGDNHAEEKLKSFADYCNAIDLYEERKFEDAALLFKKCYEEKNDFTSKVYLERCLSYIKNPPEENWDGVFVLKTK